MLDLPSGRRSSARAARAERTHRTAPVRDARPDAREEDLRRLRSLISTESISVQSPAEAKHEAVPALLELIRSNAIDGGSLDRIMQALVANEQLLPALAGMQSVNGLAGIVRRWRRRQGLDELKRAVRAPGTAVADVCALLRREWWVFGGQLVPWIGDEVVADLGGDVITLIRFDAAIHLVIVERPCIRDLVSAPDGHYVLSPRVAAAFDRARGLVRRLEEHRNDIGERLEIECGRAFVTVVIGHPDFVEDLNPDIVLQEIRVLNTFYAGLGVMTYQELIEIAEQTLDVPPAGA